MPRLPLAPPLLPDEALSSWIARIAARYDVSAGCLVGHLLPQDPSRGVPIWGGTAHGIDARPDPPLEAILAGATGQSEKDLATHRFPGLAANRKGAWLRDTPAWCPICACEDVAARGEVYARQSWGVGAYLICASHGCLLVCECPRCFSRASYQPVQGRLRLWCDRCASAADTALEPRLIPFWPFGAPQQRRRCRPVSLADDARPVLLRVQRTQLSALTGKPVRAPWTRQLKATEVTETLRRLCFIMLGPLWEDAGRPPLVRDGDDNNDRLPDDWTPGSLPAFIAAPALLAAVSFLAAESGRPLAGMTWNQRVLLVIGRAGARRPRSPPRHCPGTSASMMPPSPGRCCGRALNPLCCCCPPCVATATVSAQRARKDVGGTAWARWSANASKPRKPAWPRASGRATPASGGHTAIRRPSDMPCTG